MKLEVTKLAIEIYPENEIEEVYISNFLGLQTTGDYIKLILKGDMGGYYLSTNDFPHGAKRDVSKPSCKEAV